MPDPSDTEKTRLELEKLRFEVNKLRHDISFWAKATSIVLPIALFVVGVAQAVIAYSEFSTKQTREDRDLQLRNIESGIKLIEFASAEAGKMQKDTDLAKQGVSFVSSILPPSEACHVLNGYLAIHRATDDVARLAVAMKAQLSRGTSPVPPSCAIDPQKLQDDALVAMAQSAAVKTTATPAAAPAPAPDLTPSTPRPACNAPSPRGDTPLVVYYQIVRDTDRSLASSIGFQIPSGFPSAGIEFISEKDPSRQQPIVRYYYPTQKSEAEYLACLLTAAYRSATRTSDVTFTAQPLPSQYKNLPTKRVEVWFPLINTSN